MYASLFDKKNSFFDNNILFCSVFFMDFYYLFFFFLFCQIWPFGQLWRINEITFNFRVFNKQFMGLDKAGNGIDMVAVASKPGISETFEIIRKSDDLNRVRIRASNGFFLQVFAGIYPSPSKQEDNHRIMAILFWSFLLFYLINHSLFSSIS